MNRDETKSSPLEILDKLVADISRAGAGYTVEVVADLSRGGVEDPDAPLAVVKDAKGKVVAEALVKGRKLGWRMLVQSVALATLLQTTGCVVTFSVGGYEVARADFSDRGRSAPASVEEQEEDEYFNVIMGAPRVALTPDERDELRVRTRDLVAALDTEREQQIMEGYVASAVETAPFLMARNDLSILGVAIGPFGEGQKKVRASLVRQYQFAEEGMLNGEFELAERAFTEALEDTTRVTEDRWEISHLRPEIEWGQFVSRAAQVQSGSNLDIEFHEDEVLSALHGADVIFDEESGRIAHALVYYWARGEPGQPSNGGSPLPELALIRLVHGIGVADSADDVNRLAQDLLEALEQAE